MILDILEEELSFFDRVNDTCIGSSAFRELCVNLRDQDFNTGYIRAGLLRKELVLVFIFRKYNIPPSSTLKELYSRDIIFLLGILSYADCLQLSRSTSDEDARSPYVS